MEWFGTKEGREAYEKRLWTSAILQARTISYRYGRATAVYWRNDPLSAWVVFDGDPMPEGSEFKKAVVDREEVTRL